MVDTRISWSNCSFRNTGSTLSSSFLTYAVVIAFLLHRRDIGGFLSHSRPSCTSSSTRRRINLNLPKSSTEGQYARCMTMLISQKPRSRRDLSTLTLLLHLVRRGGLLLLSKWHFHFHHHHPSFPSIMLFKR